MTSTFISTKIRIEPQDNLSCGNQSLATVEISAVACWIFLTQLLENRMTQTIKKPGVTYNVMTIDKQHPLSAFIRSILIDFEVSIARMYQFTQEHKTRENYQNLFPDKDIIIIRLNEGASRLKINTQLVPEALGKGYIFPSGTLYEVLEGHGVRYSLVLWGNKKALS